MQVGNRLSNSTIVDAMPRQSSFDFKLERQTEECTNEDDQSKHKHVLNRGCDHNGSDDVAGDQKLQAQ